MKLHQIPYLSLIAMSLAVSACAQTADRRAVMADATTGALVGPTTFFTANASAIAAAADGAFADGAITIAKIDGLSTALDAKAPLASPSFTGTLTGGVVMAVDITTGILRGPSEELLTIDAPDSILVQTFGNLGVDAGTVSLPSTTSIGDVSATEIGYLDGVTSALQTQIGAKAPTASPTFTGTLAMSDGSGGSVSLARGSGSWALEASPNLGLDLGVSGTGVIGLFGTVSLPSTTSIGDVSATEVGYLDGVTSAIQTQLGAKAPAFVGAPASASATGVAGTLSYDASYLYVCVATDTWVRAALATW